MTTSFKPFVFAELTARLRALIRRGAHERPAVLVMATFGWIRPAGGHFAVTSNCQLGPKEFALLELFLRHPGEVFVTARILDHLWDFAYEANSNVVDQYVAICAEKWIAPSAGRIWKRYAVPGIGCALVAAADIHAD